MKKKILLCVGALLGCCFYHVEGAELRKKLQTLHREIGDSLIRLKKDHPETQTVVYSVLDQLGKYYAFSKELIVKKKEYKQLFKKELTHTENLKKESAAMKKQVEKLKTVMQVVNDKLEQDYQQADEIKAEKDILSQEKEKFLREKEQLLREKERLTAERDALLHERETLLQQSSSRFNPQHAEQEEAYDTSPQKKPTATEQPIEALASNTQKTIQAEAKTKTPALV